MKLEDFLPGLVQAPAFAMTSIIRGFLTTDIRDQYSQLAIVGHCCIFVLEIITTIGFTMCGRYSLGVVSAQPI